MQKKVLKTMKEISKVSENVFGKIAKKVIILNKIIMQNLFFFHRETLFSERQNSRVFNDFDLSFDRYQRQSINQKTQTYQLKLQHVVYMKKKFRHHRQERSQRCNRSKNHNKNLESSVSIITVKEKLFKSFDINYFHFNLLNEHEKNDYIIVSSKNTVFRDVYMFMQQVK